MKIAYLFFNGQLRGSKKFYSNLIEKQKGDIYCADGGANIAYQLNLIPKEIYGDLDSIKDEVKDFYTKKNVKFIKFNVEKDYTDSELVLYEIEKKYDKIYAIAALGGSIDHELTNINLLNRYSNLIFVSQKEKMFKIEKSYDFSNMKNKKVSFIIFSDKVENLTLKLTKDEENNRVVLGISPKYKKVNLSTIESLDFAKNSFNSIITDTVKGFFTLFSGKVSLKEVSGPVGIFKVVGEVSKFGWLSIVSLCVVLSINIGVLNLLPIPALDGGRIIFVLLELFGIKVNKKWEEKLHKGGMILLLFFILMISVNDVWKLFN